MLTMMLSQQIRIQSKTTSALLGICSATNRAARIEEGVSVSVRSISVSADVGRVPTRTGMGPGQVPQTRALQEAQMAGAMDVENI